MFVGSSKNGLGILTYIKDSGSSLLELSGVCWVSTSLLVLQLTSIWVILDIREKALNVYT